MIIIRILFIFIIIFSRTILAETYFSREAANERRSWQPFDPNVIFESLFPDEGQVEQRYRIEINIPERRLYLYEGGKLLRSHSVAVGSARYRTPVGERFLSAITWNPWWFPPPYASWAKGEKPTPPGPGNPLGRVKMSLGGDILLHGTNKEGSVGHPVSHGCMRMKNKEAEELAWFFQSRFSSEIDETLRDRYRRFPRSSFTVKLDRKIPVTIIYDRVAVRNDEVQIYPDIYGRGRNLWGELLGALSEIGVPPWEIDPSPFHRIEKSNKETKISIRDLVSPSAL